jgi:hypothetical protein
MVVVNPVVSFLVVLDPAIILVNRAGPFSIPPFPVLGPITPGLSFFAFLRFHGKRHMKG